MFPWFGFAGFLIVKWVLEQINKHYPPTYKPVDVRDFGLLGMRKQGGIDDKYRARYAQDYTQDDDGGYDSSSAKKK
jgi:hypothetical protein